MEANLSLMYVISLFSVLIAFAFAAYLFLWVRRQKSTNARINEVAALIKEGANTFMRKEYRVLSILAGIAAVIIFLLLLFFSLVGDGIGYFVSLYKEVLFRLY